MTIKTLSHETAIDKCGELAALVTQDTDGRGSGAFATAIDPLFFMRECDTSVQDLPEQSEFQSCLWLFPCGW